MTIDREMIQFLQTYMSNFWKLTKAYDNFFLENLETFNLTKNEKDVLLILYNNDDFDTATDIVKHRSISKSLVCKSVNSLVKRGFLHENVDPNDRRIIRLKISSKAQDVVKELSNTQQEFFKTIKTAFTPDEFEYFLELNRKVTNNIEERFF